MKKKAILRGILGFPIGIAIGYLSTILISLLEGQGYYSPCVPALAEAVGSEILAVLLQAVLCGLLGASCAVSSLIWKVERWSLVKQTGIYFSVLSVSMMPIAYFTYWMEHSLAGFLCYFGVFAAIFAAIWAIQYFIGRCVVRKMNGKLK